MALIPQVVDAVRVPVIAAGGIADGRGIAAAFALGASAVQIGTAYLLCPEATVRPLHRDALRRAKDDATAITNVFTGRPAEGSRTALFGRSGRCRRSPRHSRSPRQAIAPLRRAAEAQGSPDFSPLWAGQAAALAAGRNVGAGELTRLLASEALERLRRSAAANNSCEKHGRLSTNSA